MTTCSAGATSSGRARLGRHGRRPPRPGQGARPAGRAQDAARRAPATTVVRARLRAEARLAGALVHPGVAQVYDYGEDASGGEPAPYIVMQYVEGTSLLARAARAADAARRRGDGPGRPDRVGAGGGPRGRDRAPRPEAVQHPGHRRRPGRAGRLRDRPHARRRAAHRDRHRRRHRRLHQPGAVDGQVRHPASDVYSLGLVAYECLSRAQAVPPRVDRGDGARAPPGRGAATLGDDVPPAYARSSCG